MKLYKISQNKNVDYDTYDSAVVCAETPEDAKQWHPGGDKTVTTTKTNYSSWTTIENVNVEEIGEANNNQKEGIILASFNAG